MSDERYTLNKQLAQMLKGGVIMDVTTPEQAKIAEEAGACAKKRNRPRFSHIGHSYFMSTASSSEQSIIGFRPRPGRVSSPLIPSASKRFTQELTDMWVISVWSPTCSDVRPEDFSHIARQRIRKAWLLPRRKPSSSCRRYWSVSCITFIFAIVVSVMVHTYN